MEYLRRIVVNQYKEQHNVVENSLKPVTVSPNNNNNNNNNNLDLVLRALQHLNSRLISSVMAQAILG